jgi:hypothetical protein
MTDIINPVGTEIDKPSPPVWSQTSLHFHAVLRVFIL